MASWTWRKKRRVALLPQHLKLSYRITATQPLKHHEVWPGKWLICASEHAICKHHLAGSIVSLSAEGFAECQVDRWFVSVNWNRREAALFDSEFQGMKYSVRFTYYILEILPECVCLYDVLRTIEVGAHDLSCYAAISSREFQHDSWVVFVTEIVWTELSWFY